MAKQDLSKTETASQLLAQSSGKILSVSQILTSNSPKLKEITPLKATAALNLLLFHLAKFFNVGKQMTEPQIIDTSGLIIAEFPHLRIDDFALFFRRFKSGFYGAAFDRLDGNVVMVALRAYEDERRGEVTAANAKAHEEMKNTKERYHIQMGEWYLVSMPPPNDYDCTKEKALATSYDWHSAMQIKNMLLKEKAVASAKVVYHNLPTEDILKSEKEKYPWMQKLNVKEEYAAAMDRFYALLSEIDNNESLNEFERSNARRKHYGMVELTLDEWEKAEGIQENKVSEPGEIKENLYNNVCLTCGGKGWYVVPECCQKFNESPTGNPVCCNNPKEEQEQCVECSGTGKL